MIVFAKKVVVLCHGCKRCMDVQMSKIGFIIHLYSADCLRVSKAMLWQYYLQASFVAVVVFVGS